MLHLCFNSKSIRCNIPDSFERLVSTDRLHCHTAFINFQMRLVSIKSSMVHIEVWKWPAVEDNIVSNVIIIMIIIIVSWLPCDLNIHVVP